MTETNIGNAIHKTITVACLPEVAFRIWTKQISDWWPKENHSVSGHPQTAVYFEGVVGGRIYEETPEGIAHIFGEVVAWEPPNFLAYQWYPGSSAQQPTRVEIRFVPLENNQTRVDVLHRGPELIGSLWHGRKDAFNHAWEDVLLSYVQACQAKKSQVNFAKLTNK